MDIRNEGARSINSDIQSNTEHSQPRQRILTTKGKKYQQEITEAAFRSSLRSWRRQLTKLQSDILVKSENDELQKERGKLEARLDDVSDAHRKMLDMLDNTDTEGTGFDLSTEYELVINESHKILERFDEKMVELRAQDIETKSQRSPRSRKSNSSRGLSVHSSRKSRSSSSSLLSYDKKEMLVKAARLQTELEYHDVKVKGAAERQKKKDEVKELMMFKELAIANAEIKAVNKLEEDFELPSVSQRSPDHSDKEHTRLHDYLETQVTSVSSDLVQNHIPTFMPTSCDNPSTIQSSASKLIPPMYMRPTPGDASETN